MAITIKIGKAAAAPSVTLELDIRKSMNRPSKRKRKKDKKYLSDMLRGDIDTDDYHDYNDA